MNLWLVVFTSIMLFSIGMISQNVFAQTSPGGVPTSGLVAEWKFENNTLDTSGNGNNGAASGGTSYVSGKIGQALQFDGSTGIDRIPYSPTLDFPTTSFSISLWIKTTASYAGLIVDHRINNDGCYAGYSIEGSGNTGQLVGRLRVCAPASDTAANFDVVTNQVNDGTWHNIVFVVDRTSHISRIYQDNVVVNSLNITSLGNISQTMVGVDLGYTGSPNTPNAPFGGTLDQVRIYNRALNATEVSELYTESGAPVPTTPPSSPHLYAYSGNSEVGLSWTAPSSNGGAPVTNYTIYRGTAPVGLVPLKEVGNVFSYIDNTVMNGQTYYYYVTAINSGGQSLPSNEVNATPAAPTSAGATIPRTGLVAEWNFENDTFDTSGNRNDGTTGTVGYVYGGCCPQQSSVTGSAPGKYFSGKIGLALGFNGTFIDRVPASATLDFGNGSLSISGWLKTNQTSSFLFVDHRRNNDGIYSGYSLEGNNGALLGRVRDSNGHDVYVQAGPVSDNQFHHIAFVVDRSTQTSRIYLDDKLQSLASISRVGNINQNSIGVDLGYTASPNTPDSPFTGLMDQVRIYNRTLTDNDIQSLYLEGPSSGQPTSPQNLVAASGNDQATLSWSVPSSNGAAPITNYNVFRGSTSGGEAFLAKTGNALSYVDKTVSNGQKYFYKVSAINSDGESSTSNEASVVPATVPSAPQLFVSSACNREVDLNWAIPNNGGSTITNYTIYRGASSGSEAVLAEIGSDSAYSDNSTINGQTYYYYVKAVNSVGQSLPSNEVNAIPTNSSCIPTAGLAAEWKFENNALDSSGNGNNGVTSGGVSYVQGKVGQALNFSGTGIDRIPYSPSLDFPTSSFSISLWIKTTSSFLGNVVDHRANNDACYSGYSMEGYGNAGQLMGMLRVCAPASDSAANFFVVTNPVNDGAWHHVVLVVDRASHISKIYQDDVLVNSRDISLLGSISQTSVGVDLGYTGAPNTPNDPFTGALDQVRIYNIALSNSQISSLYKEQPPSGIVLNGVNSTSGTTSSSNLITLSNFNAGSASNHLLVVGISANNAGATSVTFNGQPLTRAVSSFNNNDAEFWILNNPSGTGNIVATFAGQTQAVVGAYSLANVNQTSPIANTAKNTNTASSSPSISIATKHANDLVLDLPSIYGGQKLGSPTCTQEWDTNIPSAITGASSSISVPSLGSVTCGWAASNGGDLWDDVAVEVKSTG